MSPRHVTCVLCLLLVTCTAPPRRLDTIYRLKSRGTIDLSANPHARHCSKLTKDFRDAYQLEDGVQTILSVAVVPDETSMVLRVADKISDKKIPSSHVIGGHERLRAFWYYDGWTLAVALDHRHCPGSTCAGEISLINYNGAWAPNERVNKLCFERWVGTFTRVSRERTSSAARGNKL